MQYQLCRIAVFVRLQIQARTVTVCCTVEYK